MLHKGARAEKLLEALNDYGAVFVGRFRFSTLTPDKSYPVMTYEDAQFVVVEAIKGPLFLGLRILREFIKHPPKKALSATPRDCPARHWPGSGRPVYPPQLTF
jgi:hypothetical protein